MTRRSTAAVARREDMLAMANGKDDEEPATARGHLELWAMRPSGGKASRDYVETVCGSSVHAQASGYRGSKFRETHGVMMPIMNGDVTSAKEKAATQLEKKLKKEGVL